MTQTSKERRGYWPQMTTAERDRRWAAARRKMAVAGLDALVIWATESPLGWGLANFKYITRLGGHRGGFCLFPLDGEPMCCSNRPTRMCGSMHS